MACNYCKSELYIKTIQYSAPMLAPLTIADELRNRLLDLTGEVYVRVPNQYCAMCGEKINRLDFCTDKQNHLRHCEDCHEKCKGE